MVSEKKQDRQFKSKYLQYIKDNIITFALKFKSKTYLLFFAYVTLQVMHRVLIPALVFCTKNSIYQTQVWFEGHLAPSIPNIFWSWRHL